MRITPISKCSTLTFRRERLRERERERERERNKTDLHMWRFPGPLITDSKLPP
jgi:hypothetical protein